MAQKIKRADKELYVSGLQIECKADGSGTDRVLHFIGSTETVDRDNDIIEVAGWQLDNYLKNPVFLWAHDYTMPPIGRALNVEKGPVGLKFDIGMPPEGVYPFADMVYELYRQKFLNATSVGFIPIKYKIRDDEAVLDKPEWQRGNRFIEQELLELSGCPVPSNPAALQLAQDKGYVTPEDAAELKLFMMGQVGSGLKTCRAMEGLYKAEIDLEHIETPKDGKKVFFFGSEDKRAIPYKETPKAPEDEKWDGPAEVAAADQKELHFMCAWCDSQAADDDGDGWPDQKQAYKLPHHKHGGNHPVVWQGVSAAMEALLGARGGVDIPEGDRKAVYNHLVKHYKQFDKTPPDFKELSEECVKGNAEKQPLEKAGAVLSQSNKENLQQALALIQAVLDSAEPVQEQFDDDIDLAAIDTAKDTLDGKDEVNIEPETLKQIINDAVQEQLDKAMGKVKN